MLLENQPSLVAECPVRYFTIYELDRIFADRGRKNGEMILRPATIQTR